MDKNKNKNLIFLVNIYLIYFIYLNWGELKQREYLFSRHQEEVLGYRVSHFQ
jgi:hypothetical protein